MTFLSFWAQLRQFEAYWQLIVKVPSAFGIFKLVSKQVLLLLECLFKFFQWNIINSKS